MLDSETCTIIDNYKHNSVIGYLLTGYHLASDINTVSYYDTNPRLYPLIYSLNTYVSYAYTGICCPMNINVRRMLFQQNEYGSNEHNNITCSKILITMYVC